MKPAIIQAREVAARNLRANGWHTMAAEVLIGLFDSKPIVQNELFIINHDIAEYEKAQRS